MKLTLLLPRHCVVLALLCLTCPLFADESEFLLSPDPAALVSTLGKGNSNTDFAEESPSPSIHKHPLRTVISSLAIVLGGFFLLTALVRNQGRTKAPTSELMETLGAIQLTPKVKLHLVRIGSRLLVLHLGANSVERVAEISDPEEVQSLLHGHMDDRRSNLASHLGSLDSHPQVDDLLRSTVALSGGVNA